MSKTFHLVSLGCAKNTVDSESMGELMIRSGYRFELDQSQAEVLIVNTCGFIGPAKTESLQVLGELAEHKKRGQMLIAAGCLTQRYGAEVVRQVPGIDGILGTRRWMDIVDVVQELRNKNHQAPLYHLPESQVVGTDERGTIRAAIQGASAYIKIADGCRRPCAFCAIPLICRYTFLFSFFVGFWNSQGTFTWQRPQPTPRAPYSPKPYSFSRRPRLVPR